MSELRQPGGSRSEFFFPVLLFLARFHHRQRHWPCSFSLSILGPGSAPSVGQGYTVQTWVGEGSTTVVCMGAGERLPGDGQEYQNTSTAHPSTQTSSKHTRGNRVEFTTGRLCGGLIVTNEPLFFFFFFLDFDFNISQIFWSSEFFLFK